jgi:hypothetical protein
VGEQRTGLSDMAEFDLGLGVAGDGKCGRERGG